MQGRLPIVTPKRLLLLAPFGLGWVMGIVGGYGLDIVVIEQERGVLFNRAKLFNVFYREFGGLYDYYIFHDVDMIPEVVDYGYHEGVCHLAGRGL